MDQQCRRVGTFVAAAVLIGQAIGCGRALGRRDGCGLSRSPRNPRFVLNSFGVICFGLVGLELASVMGDEINDPRALCPARWHGAAYFPVLSMSAPL